MPANLDGNDASRNFLRELKIAALIGGFLILLYSLRFRASGQLLRILGVGLLVAGAALLSGFLLGFIFAIPRVGDKRKRAAGTQPQSDQDAEASSGDDPVPLNANLVEISDWLTKIIVGVGLIELRSIPAKLGLWSYYLAPGLLPAPCASGPCVEPLAGGQAAGLAILILYFAMGFLLGYVWTMIFFQGDLEGKLRDAEQRTKTERRRQLTANSMNAAEAYINMGQLDAALNTMDKALTNDPRNGYAVMTKARILKRQALQFREDSPDRKRLLQQAIACADQAIALLPNKGEPLYNRACYQALLDPAGLKSEVLESLKSAFRLNASLRQVAKEGDDDLNALRDDADFNRLTGRDQPPDA